MAEIYIDESGGFDAEKEIFLVGAHLCFDSAGLDLGIQLFEDELYSNVKYQTVLDDYEKQGIHACKNSAMIKNLFSSFLNRATGRYAFAFTREKTLEQTPKEQYIHMVAGLVRTLIMKANNQGEVAHLIYELSENYLSGNDNGLLQSEILEKNKNANITIRGDDKKFKKLGFVDYASNLLYVNIRRVLNNRTPKEEVLNASLYEFIEQNTSFIWDMDRKKWLEPRKLPKNERALDFWLKQS